MESQKDPLDDKIRKAKVEQMWLNFYNDILLEKGLISASEHQKMKIQICTMKDPIR